MDIKSGLDHPTLPDIHVHSIQLTTMYPIDQPTLPDTHVYTVSDWPPNIALWPQSHNPSGGWYNWLWSNNCWLDHLLQRLNSKSHNSTSHPEIRSRRVPFSPTTQLEKNPTKFTPISSPAQTSQLKGCQSCENFNCNCFTMFRTIETNTIRWYQMFCNQYLAREPTHCIVR